MRFEKFCITTARIIGLNNNSILCVDNCVFLGSIYFLEAGSKLKNYSCVLGNYLKEAQSLWENVKDMFAKAHIHNGDKVNVIFREDHSVRAIGSIKQNLWIDVDDKFAKKSFEELNITVSSLEEH